MVTVLIALCTRGGLSGDLRRVSILLLGSRSRKRPLPRTALGTMKTATDKMWNLTADQWSSVLDSRADPADVAARLKKAGLFVPWSQVLVDETADCVSTVDLGCGRGEHSAVLARAGRQTTLVDWSQRESHLLPWHVRRARARRDNSVAPISPARFRSNPTQSMWCSAAACSNISMPSQIDAIMSEAFPCRTQAGDHHGPERAARSPIASASGTWSGPERGSGAAKCRRHTPQAAFRTRRRRVDSRVLRGRPAFGRLSRPASRRTHAVRSADAGFATDATCSAVPLQTGLSAGHHRREAVA